MKPAKSKTKKPKAKIAGNNIKAILKEIKMSQEELADIVETNAGHISAIIKGDRKSISLPIAMKIAKALKRPVEEVFTYENKK